jgi:hypothetical protein
VASLPAVAAELFKLQLVTASHFCPLMASTEVRKVSGNWQLGKLGVLPPELIRAVFERVASVADALSLAGSCLYLEGLLRKNVSAKLRLLRLGETVFLWKELDACVLSRHLEGMSGGRLLFFALTR